MSERTWHTLVPMSGRDPHEPRRSASSLELLFDLTFVIAFGAAADELAAQIAKHHAVDGLVGFAFATFAVTWAWIFWSWFSSAYDTDDWLFRLLTMAQMMGVLVLALGLPAMFESLAAGEPVDNDVMVWGYVVMRVPMLLQWHRAGRQDPDRARVAVVMKLSILVSQAIWCVLALIDLHAGAFFAVIAVPLAIELLGPVLAETRYRGTPWHAHHMAERYGLLVIITLGEGLLGTVIALRVLIGDGWSTDIVVLLLAGTTATFGLWWFYFVVPHGELLDAHRERSFGWGYGHLPLFAGLVGVGAGLHVAAYQLGEEYDVATLTAVWAFAIPLAVAILWLYVLYTQISRSVDPFHLALVAITVAVLAAGVLLAAAGVAMVWCVLVLATAPWVTVVGYEVRGHEHNEQVLAALRK